ncbi:MAG: hypothetical protein HKN23_07295 [Verrucomicrobiales bacterium]|nr:hypothetical protein [Verrucomicrobiales bacterium]
MDSLIVWYLVILLGALFLVWVAAEIFQRGRERRRRKNFVICSICEHVFEDESGQEIVTCPSCQALNERESVREI